MKVVNTIATTVTALLACCCISLASAQPFQIPMMKISTNAFEDGGVIPEKFSMYGGGTQPDFTISGAPESTVSYAIIFHDIDVALPGTTDDVTHWVAWNIPSNVIAEGELPEGSVEGINATQQPGYFGPGAPSGERYHHYVFEFYALSANLELDTKSGKAELLEAMSGKVVAKAAYVGRFKKSD